MAQAVSYRYEFGFLGGKTLRPKMFEKELVLLPQKERKKLKFHEAMEFSKTVGVPISTLAWKFSGVKFLTHIPETAKVSFVWLDTVNNVPTTLHVYDEQNGFQRYGDIVEGWTNLGDVVVGLDLFRYQFRHLARIEDIRYCFNEYHLGRNTFYGPKFKLAIDLTFWVRVVSGKRPVRYVAELGLPTGNKLSMAISLYEHLDIPTLFNVLSEVLQMDRNLMQLSYLDALKLYMLHSQYLREGYLVTAPPQVDPPDEPAHSAYVNVPGFYENMVEYDVSSAYPTTVLVERVDPFGTDVFPNLMSYLMTKKQLLPDSPARDLVKKLSVAFVGIMNYHRDRFRNVFYNPRAWLKVINGFYNRFKKVIDEYNPVWSRVDALLVPATSPPPSLGFLYKFGVKHHYKWVAIYENDHLLGEDVSDPDELVKKGFDFSTPWGNAAQLPIVFRRAQGILEHMIRSSPREVLYSSDVVQTLLDVLKRSISDRLEDYVIVYLKSEKEIPQTVAKSEIWGYLSPGYNRGVVGKDGFYEPESLSPSDVNYRFYVRGIVDSLVQYFPPDRWDPGLAGYIIDEFVRQVDNNSVEE